MVAGESGIGPITVFDASAFTTRIAGEVKDFNADELIGKKESRRMDRFSQYALAAAIEAIADAALPEDQAFRDNVGAVIGSGIGGIQTFWYESEKAKQNGNWVKTSPFFIPSLMANAAPAQISMRYGFRGGLFSIASACASANDAIVTAYHMVASGD